MRILNLSNRIIEYSYYLLFLLVPLVFSSQTSELFELNKMWLTFGLTILILTAWIIKMIVSKKIWIQKTPLDIPIVIFLASQIISTVISWDPYVSIWGYYSRFNGGLLSIISYIILYYAFLSNFSIGNADKTKEHQAIDIVKRLLGISLVSGAIVALWGLPSHFGYDPTCFIFRRSLDVSCWTADFQPKIRIFSTLGQPAWLGAYLTILIPLSIAYFINAKRKLFALGIALLAVIFYADLIFTRARAAIIAFWLSTIVFLISYYWFEFKKKNKSISVKKIWRGYKPILIILIALVLTTAILLNPIQINKGKISLQSQKITPTQQGSFSSGGGGTESGQIRLLVWQGALTTWLHYPIFGTGVETFAFAYYKYRPVAHNLTSEWNFLYNKAHNEYLNYLATTGIVGFGAYLGLICVFLLKTLKVLQKKKFDVVIFALLAGYLGILITNFFGFSVVIINIYFFMIPAFVFVLSGMINKKDVFVHGFGKSEGIEKLSLFQKLDVFVTVIVALYLLMGLFNFWLADQAYALGLNLSRSGEYDKAYLSLREAVTRASFEPTFRDELASNDSILAVSLLSQLSSTQKNATEEATFIQNLAKESIIATTQVTGEHPKNVVFWKTKVRVFYTLSQVDPKYVQFALDAIKQAQQLAPTDANITYNLALLYGQSNENKKAIDTLIKTIKLKPNYTNAYYALGLFYRQEAVNDKGIVINEDFEKKAEAEMNFILQKLDPNNQDAKQALDQWSGRTQ